MNKKEIFNDVKIQKVQKVQRKHCKHIISVGIGENQFPSKQ